jgi:hypothetical protein
MSVKLVFLTQATGRMHNEESEVSQVEKVSKVEDLKVNPESLFPHLHTEAYPSLRNPHL